MYDAWLHLARENELAAMRLLTGEFHRSAVSRFYYGAFAAAHATLILRKYTPPELGNWGHAALPETLEAGLGGGRDAALYAEKLAELYTLRIEADYGVRRAVDADAAVRSRRLAGPLVRLAERAVER